MGLLSATSYHQWRVVTTNLWQLPTIGFSTAAQLPPASFAVITNIAISFTWSDAINSHQTCMLAGCTDAKTISLSGANLKSNHLASKLAKNGIVCSYRSERPSFWLVVTALVVTADPQWLIIHDDMYQPWKCICYYDDVIKWKHFPRYWAFVRGIHRSQVNSTHKGRRGALRFSLVYAWINGWVNNREAGDLRHHRAHYEITVTLYGYHNVSILLWSLQSV